MDPLGFFMKSPQEPKKEMLEVCRRMYAKGFVAANDGNVSIRISEKILTTPTGKSKGFLRFSDLVWVNLDGKQLEGKLRPTSELLMHLFVYKKRKDVKAVVHAHPPYSTALAIAGIKLPDSIMPEVITSLGEIPLAPYGTQSTREVPDSISDLIKNHDAIILRNHGVLTVGKDLSEAYFKLERVEHYAQVFCLAKPLGELRKLSPKQLEKLSEIKKKFR
jgi:L-fuculose-phosphate aldolase